MVEAIETRAYGCRFRSRLEARWAVFFTALKIEWDYEREGLAVNGRPYLPDFWLPSVCPSEKALGWGQWLEIKPTWPLSSEQLELYADVAKETGHRLLAFCGTPWSYRAYVFQHHHNGSPARIPYCSEGSLLEDRRLGGVCVFEPLSRYMLSLSFETPVGALDAATVASRSARFEHGENPRQGG